MLQHEHVLEHVFGCDGASAQWVGVLRVDTFEEHGFAVDIHLRISDGNLAETIFRGEGHDVVAFLVLLDEAHGVEFRRFGRPEFHVLQFERLGGRGLFPVALCLDFGEVDGVGRFLEEASLRIEEFDGDETRCPVWC